MKLNIRVITPILAKSLYTVVPSRGLAKRNINLRTGKAYSQVKSTSGSIVLIFSIKLLFYFCSEEQKILIPEMFFLFKS